jgi:hypothetical protein
MKEYCKNDTMVAEPDQLAPEDVWPGYMSLAARYGLGDEMQIGSSSNHQTGVPVIHYGTSLPGIDGYHQVLGGKTLMVLLLNTVRLIDSQVNGTTFLTLFKMAMDYLPIQALAVPCE